MRWGLVFVISGALVAACSPAASSTRGATSFDATTLVSCDEAFRVWVDRAASLNSPDTDLVDMLVVQESVQRRVFELCSLAEAERYNREMPLELAPGIVEPMIEPDFRTFAEIECIDESPLLDGTPLCEEVAH
jgi:hypothetical protein